MTRRIHAGAATLGLLLVTTACGTANTVNPGGPDTEVVSTVVSPPGSPVDPPTGLNQATPDPTVIDLREVAWQKATAGPDTKLVVQYTASGRPECSKLGRADVTETDQAVTVKVLLGQVAGVDCTGPQPMIAATFQTVVELKTPLGDRPVS
jgi:hypothetical protein